MAVADLSFSSTSAVTEKKDIRERPILFQGPMVRALLAGTKTQTRRALRDQPDEHHWQLLPGYELKRSKIVTIKERCAVKFSHSIPQNREWETALDWLLCPYGQPGDQLWVRETWNDGYAFEVTEGSHRVVRDAVYYRADCRPDGLFAARPWRPAIHMPRRASRIQLEVSDVRVQRLQDISEEDAKAEGIHKPVGSQFWHSNDLAHLWDGGGGLSGETPQHAYRNLWERINGDRSWDANPWVWAVSFKRVKP